MSAAPIPYAARMLTPAHAGLANSGGVPARLANERYVESLARVVYVWGYPAVNTFGRTSCWEVMREAGPGATMGLFPGAPKNRMGYLADYMSPAQRKVVTPNNDTIYGVCFADLGEEPVVVQTPEDVPAHHYWTIQIVDLFTTVIRQLGIAAGTPAGKFLLVGPEWNGKAPKDFIEIIRSPTNYAVIMARSFAAHSDEAKEQARRVLDQIGVVPLSDDRPGRRLFDCAAVASNKVYPPGITAEVLAADPDLLRIRPVDPATFWDHLEHALDANPVVGPDDAPLAVQARTLIALRKAHPSWRTLLDHAALAADADLQESARYEQVGVDAGKGWQRQENGGLWGADWLGRAQAAVIYIFVNDYREAIYFVRGTDADGALLHGRYRYEMTFPKGVLPPVDRARGGFWSLTMYDKDYYMLAASPNGRTNIGTVNLDADELEFARDGSLTLHISSEPPDDPAALANWLPAPDAQFALLVRAYVPNATLLDGRYSLPDVTRLRVAENHAPSERTVAVPVPA